MIATENDWNLVLGESKIQQSNFKNVQIQLWQMQTVENIFSLDQTKDVVFVSLLEKIAKEYPTRILMNIS